jgi:hypothetical protein
MEYRLRHMQCHHDAGVAYFTSLTSGQRLSRHFGRVTTLWETLDGRGDFIVLTAPNKDTLPRSGTPCHGSNDQ